MDLSSYSNTSACFYYSGIHWTVLTFFLLVDTHNKHDHLTCCEYPVILVRDERGRNDLQKHQPNTQIRNDLFSS